MEPLTPRPPHSIPVLPPPPPSADSNFPILAISILGVLSTCILLLSYYIFTARCLRLHRFDAVSRLSFPSRRSQGDEHPVTYHGAAVAESNGLCESEIQALPTFGYRSGSAGRASYFRECAVCLSEFREEERLRLLPNCFHVFHIHCIDTWLRANTNCPLCRAGADSPAPLDRLVTLIGDVVIDVRDTAAEAARRSKGTEGTRRGSMGDECVHTRQPCVPQPMRRSLSVDSSMDRRLHAEVQKIVRQNPHFPEFAVGKEAAVAAEFGDRGSPSTATRAAVAPPHSK